jgi:hypothetical protein
LTCESKIGEKNIELPERVHNPCEKNEFEPWDRCYDFLNIFTEKFGQKIGVFLLKT